MRPASSPVLDIRGLTVSLPSGGERRNALENVSLSVAPGELVCVVGESGSGKSVMAFTTMGLLPGGRLRPTAGAVLLNGENLLEASPARLRALRGATMGMVFQEPMTALNPVQTVGAQIDEVLRIHTALDAAARRARVLSIMMAMMLPEPERLYDCYPHQLSGGQRQRVVIAAAMVMEPTLLIADEPTTALDVTTQAQILVLIKDLQRKLGTGVLFITHDFGVVADIADRVVVMQQGVVVEQGSAAEVLQRPKHPYTQALIDAVPATAPPIRAAVAGEKAIEVNDLGKEYPVNGSSRRVVKAVEAVSFDLKRAETLGIVGESGSGKTTVARCIARLINPTTGRIRLQGHDIAAIGERALRPYRRRIQVVFQDPYRSLNPRRTIEASIIEGPINFGVSRRTAMARARELMELVCMPAEALDRYPHQFSGGQRQRIAIARALAMEPEVLIADEAMSALDVSVQKQVLHLLDEVRAKFNLAVLFITHDLRVAAQICDRIIVMKDGRIVEQGPTQQLFEQPQHSYTQTLLAAMPGRDFAFAKPVAE